MCADSRALTAEQAAAMIDHTLLKPQATQAQIERLCAEARRYHFGAVCVNPVHVPLCRRRLAGSGVEIATVVGFPLGATLTEVKVYEAQAAIGQGAGEVDMVINIGALKEGRLDEARRDVSAVAAACHERRALLKVIIETAYLTEEEKIAACRLCRDAGADYVKTSTGFGPGGATVEDVALMRRVVGPDMGVKAAGGIRTYRDLAAMVEAGANRIGASAGVQIMQELAG